MGSVRRPSLEDAATRKMRRKGPLEGWRPNRRVRLLLRSVALTEVACGCPPLISAVTLNAATALRAR